MHFLCKNRFDSVFWHYFAGIIVFEQTKYAKTYCILILLPNKVWLFLEKLKFFKTKNKMGIPKMPTENNSYRFSYESCSTLKGFSSLIFNQIY